MGSNTSSNNTSSNNTSSNNPPTSSSALSVSSSSLSATSSAANESNSTLEATAIASVSISGESPASYLCNLKLEIKRLEASQQAAILEFQEAKELFEATKCSHEEEMSQSERESDESLLKATETKLREEYSAALKEYSNLKDAELAKDIHDLTSVTFMERRGFSQADILGKYHRDLESAWEKRHAELIMMQEKDKGVILRISRSEHEKVHQNVVKLLDAELSQLEQKVRANRKRSGGLLSFLTPNKKIKDSDDSSP